ncbi:probable sugar phosphate/phosphate translocator At2g25520 [Chenopodium quinoa]|nr:probable sugar phosphate/phosphate translocator At2g25520 [Chenopodium quinoa]
MSSKMVASTPSLSEGIIKKIILTYTYISIWLFFSFSVIIYNKYILDKKLYNWPYPITLTMIHMSFSSILSFLLVRVFHVVESPLQMTKSLYISSILPIGVLFALSLWLSNSAYIYLSVSFIQMLKALMPVIVYSIGVILKKDSFKTNTMANMISISIGVGIAAYGEAKFDVYGVILQLGALIFEATRLVLIQILLTSKGIQLNPITSLYYIAPCCLIFLTVPWLFVEYPLLMAQTKEFEFDFVIFGSNSLIAFGLNLAVFLLVGKTSALTMNVAGVVKDWLLIAFSWSVIKDTVTPINLLGYLLAFLGVVYYNRVKFQSLKASEGQAHQKKDNVVDYVKVNDDEESVKKLLDDRDSNGVKKDDS